METVNERILHLIEREGLSIGTFAKKCGVPDSTIRSIVNTDRKPGFDLLVKIIETVDRPWCDANWLVLGQQTAEDQDNKKLLKIISDQQRTISDQQRTIEEQRKRIDTLTDKLLGDSVK